MATDKKSAKNSKLKIGKSVVVNKWLALGFVAVVVASAIVIVRYSGASGEVWSINSSNVTHAGGEVRKKDTGYSYWVGKSGSVAIGRLTAGTYCVEGSYGQAGSSAAITILDYSHPARTQSVAGNSGQFSKCLTVASTDLLITLSPTSGTIVFNRFRKK